MGTSSSDIAIIGSGIVGTTIAYFLARKGHSVDVFEKGPSYAYPHSAQFQEVVRYMHDNSMNDLPRDLKHVTQSGDYSHSLNRERVMVVGGSATQWQAVTLRMTPGDLRTRSVYGYGTDWPITYDELEPYYCMAEAFLGVSGTDVDNPFAPRRSRPYPLPPFELSFDDLILADRLRRRGLLLHTTPQARTRLPYESRPECVNFGTCSVCPIGARYSPNYHLQRAVATGLCQVRENTSVRRLLLDKSGSVKGLVYQHNVSRAQSEHSARVVVLSAGAIESARLLLLSSRDRHADGWDFGEHLGAHLVFHHLWGGHLRFREPLYPGRIGAYTAQCHQFLDPPGRGRHGGVKVEFTSSKTDHPDLQIPTARTGSEVVNALKPIRHTRIVILHAESTPAPGKEVTLSVDRDRFGDPYAHVHYAASDFDAETFQFARKVFDQFAMASGAVEAQLASPERFHSGFHHLGGCRMGGSRHDSVVDSFGQVHGTRGLLVAGGGTFVSAGAVNPTLTMVALAMRTADYVTSRFF